MRDNTFLRSAALALTASIFASSAAWAQGGTRAFTAYEQQMKNGLSGWDAHLGPIAATLLGALFIAECTLTFIERGTEGVGLDRIGGELIRKGIMCSAVAWLFFNPDIVIRPLIQGFAGVGGLLNGGTTYQPVDVLAQPHELNKTLLAAFTKGIPEVFDALGGFTGVAWSAVTGSLDEKLIIAFVQIVVGYFMILLCMLVIFIGFMSAAMQLFLTSMEMLFIVATAPFFSGFASFRVTAGMTDAYLKYVVQVAVKFFFINFMVGTGMVMATKVWEPMLTKFLWLPYTSQLYFLPVIDFTMLFSVVGMVAAYAYLVWKIPGAFAQKLAGEVRFGIREGAVARAVA